MSMEEQNTAKEFGESQSFEGTSFHSLNLHFLHSSVCIRSHVS